MTELREALFGEATRRMLEAAHLKVGDHVLDIAAGTGDQSLKAARIVGPAGSVLATDISQEMLDVASRLARQEGLGNLATRVMNAERLDLPENRYDAVISRLGLMLVERLPAALSEIRRVLKPGGRLAALVWSAPERNPLFALYIDLVAKSLNTAQPEERWSDPFSLADAVFFARALSQAGFQDVQVHTMPLTFHFPSFDVLATWWGPRFDELSANLEPTPRQRMLEDVRQAIRPYEGPAGIQAPAELLLAAGMK
ncbi:MAG: methyltransferase domain-containing protein [Chloroflexota bacterium]